MSGIAEDGQLADYPLGGDVARLQGSMDSDAPVGFLVGDWAFSEPKSLLVRHLGSD
ncbi:MAG: hypothetical protein AAGD22_01185 [Verrucomicrobiota bacterium]